MTSRADISVPATLTSIRSVRNWVARIAVVEGADSQLAADIKLCVDEAVTNAIAHGYEDDSAVVEVSVESDGRELTVVVRDQGKGVDQFRQEGELGFGLKIIDRLTRRYMVSSAPKLGTEVRMTFALSGLLAKAV
jgi:stage II sporulation protein AB (anti-sigma F factor)